MKKIVLVFVIVLFMFGLPPTNSLLAEDSVDVNPDIQASIINFSGDLLRQYSPDENTVVSPLSAYYVLAMLMAFSDNEAQAQLEDLLSISRDDLLNHINSLIDTLPLNDSDTSFWMSNDLLYDFYTPIYNLDNITAFADMIPYTATQVGFSNGDAAEFLANKVTEGTDGYLQLTPLDLMFMNAYTISFSNAIYYTGTWKTEFDDRSNYDGTFLVDGEEEGIAVTYMAKNDAAKYYETDLAKIAKSYYMDNSSMLFIVPKDGYGISDVLSSDTEIYDILSNQENFVSTNLNLTLPKFSLAKMHSLIETFENMGLVAPFSVSETTFTRLTDQPFVIDQILQNVKIDVDEHGVKAASLTVAVGCATAAPPQYFNVDKSFIFVLLDASDTPMFIGIVHTFE